MKRIGSHKKRKDNKHDGSLQQHNKHHTTRLPSKLQPSKYTSKHHSNGRRLNRRVQCLVNLFLQSFESDGTRREVNSNDAANATNMKLQSENIANEIEQLLNMTKIPLYVEKFMLFSLLEALDGFLYYFTVLPIKIIQGLFAGNSHTSDRKIKNGWLLRTYKERCTLFLIIASSLILTKLDTSKVYHRIKRQNSMKLYMLFSLLEMSDKMLASVGQSLLSVLLSSTYWYKNNRLKQFILVVLNTIYLISHGYILIYQAISLNVAVNSYNNSLAALLLSMQFSEIKGAVFKKIDKEGLFQLAISDVVQRFKIFLWLFIIILRNLGTTVTNETLSIRAILWRGFVNFGIPTKISLVSLISWSPMLNVFFSEIFVDWMKHAYITKFNRIRPQLYNKYFHIMYKDSVVSLSQYQERLGLPLPVYVIVFLVMIKPVIYRSIKSGISGNSNPNSSLVISFYVVLTIATSFSMLLILRFITHSILLTWGSYIRARNPEISTGEDTLAVTERDYVPGMLSEGHGKMDSDTRSIIYSPENPHDMPQTPPSLNQRRHKRDASNPTSLETVTRYKMVSKRIW